MNALEALTAQLITEGQAFTICTARLPAVCAVQEPVQVLCWSWWRS